MRNLCSFSGEILFEDSPRADGSQAEQQQEGKHGNAVFRLAVTTGLHKVFQSYVSKLVSSSLSMSQWRLCLFPLTGLCSLPQNPISGLRAGKPLIQAAVTNGNAVLPDSDDHVS